MIAGLSRLVQWYYFLALTVVAAAITGAMYFYWKSGLMDVNYISSIYDVSAMLDDLNKSDYPLKVKNLVENDQVKSGVKLFSAFETKINEIKALKNTGPLHEELNNSGKELKKTMLKLFSYPEISSLMKVFDAKVDKFREFVIQKKYQSLTRISARIESKIYDIKEFSFDRMKSVHRSIVQDLSIMRNVAETSSLPKYEINVILMRIQSLQVEMTMLQNILYDLEHFSAGYSKFYKAYENWHQKFGPEISLEKLRIVDKNKIFLYGIFGSVILILFFIGLGFYVYGKDRYKANRKIEDFVLKLIKEQILSAKFTPPANYSSKFRAEIEKNHAYVQKRLSYSSIFQSALPFASILLDSNLKVIWANNLFCETFKLENFDFNQKSLSWDYLLRFTNLGEADPVIEALQNDLAGIYQVLVKVDQASPAVPYEMYLAPVGQPNQKNIMIFFYPLSSMEETIINQGLTLVDPIKRTLNSFLRGEFTTEFQGQVSKDFDLAGIYDIYEKFSTYHDFVVTQKMGLLAEIDRLENEVSAYQNKMEKISKVNDDFRAGQEEFYKGLKELKQTIISLAAVNHEYGDLNFHMVDLNKEITKEYKRIDEVALSLHEKIKDCKNTVEYLSNLKQDFKILKNNLQTTNARLSQNIDHVLMFEKTETVDKKRMEQAFVKVKADVKSIAREIQSLEKTMTAMDIQISKTEAIIKGNSMQVSDEMMAKFGKTLVDFENEMESGSFDKSQLSQESYFLEEKIIKEMQQIFDVYKVNLSHHHQVHNLVAGLLEPSPLVDADAEVAAENPLVGGGEAAPAAVAELS